MSENFENELDMMELTDEDLEAVAGGKKIVATGSVKVRKGPGLQYGLLGYLQKGDFLTYDGHSEKDDRGVRWYRVKYPVQHQEVIPHLDPPRCGGFFMPRQSAGVSRRVPGGRRRGPWPP